MLDEPTSALDTVTEVSVARAVAAHRRGAATVVLSASEVWCAAADRVLTVTEQDVAPEHTAEGATS